MTTYLFRCVAYLWMFYGIAHAATESEFRIPSMNQPVVDAASILSPATTQTLNALLQRLYAQGGSQIAVLTVPSLGDLTIEDASIRVVESWKLGRQDQDDGILLMVAPAQRRVRIEVGRGREGDLTDAYSRRIINQVIAPAFKVGDFDQGIQGAVLAIIAVTDPKFDLNAYGSRPSRISGEKTSGAGKGLIQLIIIVLFVGLSILMGVLRMLGIVSPQRSYHGGWHSGGFRSGGGGFGSGSGGSWGGGGGGFSGGGSSGSW